MNFSKIYIAAAVAGIVGAIAGAFVGGFIAASRCEGGLECLGTAFLGVGLGAIFFESSAMSVAAHIANQRQGNLLLTFLPTLLLAVPIPIAMPAFFVILALPLFFFQTWVCVKVELATSGRKSARRRA